MYVWSGPVGELNQQQEGDERGMEAVAVFICFWSRSLILPFQVSANSCVPCVCASGAVSSGILADKS